VAAASPRANFSAAGDLDVQRHLVALEEDNRYINMARREIADKARSLIKRVAPYSLPSIGQTVSPALTR
jgi:hypothetical protein